MARVYVLLAAALFSTGGAAIKWVELSSWEIAGFRSGIAAAVLWLLVPAWRGWPGARGVAVAAAYAATLVLFVTANTLTTAANSIFLQTSAPLYVLLAGPLLLGERTRASDLLVVAVLATGLVLFFLGAEAPQRTAPDPTTGNWIALASGVTWAASILGLRALGREPARGGRDATGQTVVVGNALAFAVCLPFALPLGPSAPVDWAVVFYLGAIQIGLAYVFLVRAVRGTRALDVSLLLVLEPVLSVVWAWAAHGELPGAWSSAGCGLILAGVLTQALRAPKPELGP